MSLQLLYTYELHVLCETKTGLATGKIQSRARVISNFQV